MANCYVGEIRMFGGNFAPVGWAFCNGQLLPISENEVLFNLIGTTYGGDGQETFAMPDLRGRVPLHQGTYQGNTHTIGELGGVESVTLTINQIPIHNHVPLANSGNATTLNPQGNFWAAQPAMLQYSGPGSQNTNMKANAILPSGGSQPHENLHPYVAVSFIISLFGIFPNP